MEKRGGYNKLKLSRKNITSLSQSLNKKKNKTKQLCRIQ